MEATVNGRDQVKDMGATTIQSYFDRTSEYWDTLYEGDDFIHRHMDDRRRRVLSAVDEVSGGLPLRVLDLGCGTGILTQQLLRKGHYVAAVDCSENMLKRLRAQADGYFESRFLGALQADVSDTSLATGGFDLVLCVGVLQYQQKEGPLLAEISRVLKSGGHCIITVPNLLTVAHLTDPVYGIRFLKRIWQRRIAKTEAFAGESGAFRLVGEHGSIEPYNKKYLKSEIRLALDRHGLELRSETGYGFGPLTFAGKELFPDRFSAKVSDAVTTIATRPGMRWLTAFANRWVFIAQKI